MDIKINRLVNELTETRLEQEIALVQKTLSYYPLDATAVTLIQANHKASVWHVETNEGPKALKWLNVRSGKALYSILTHHYLYTQGLLVPRISYTNNGYLCLGHDNRIGFLAQWMQGRPIDRHSEEEWELFIKTLAEFHLASRGMQTRSEIRTKSKLGSWPLEYQKKIGKMKHWYAVSANLPGQYFSSYRELAPQVIARAEMLLEELVRSEYWNWVEELAQTGGLCHGDYGESNTVLQPDGRLAIIDMDTVTQDLPIRDLRKVFETHTNPSLNWLEILQQIIRAYTKVNPLSPEQIKVFLIDIQFPYEFYQNAKKAFVLGLQDEVGMRRICALDLSRSTVADAYLQAM